MRKYRLFDKTPINIVISESVPEKEMDRLDKVRIYFKDDLSFIIVETEPGFYALAIPLNIELNLKILEKAIANIKV